MRKPQWITCRALGGALVNNFSVKSFDLTTPDGQRVQVKTRVVSVPVRHSQLQAIVFRSWDFEQPAFVLLRDIDYRVHRAVLVPVHVVREKARPADHVNGWRVSMTSDLLDHLDAEDFTAAARRAAATA